MSIKQLSIFDDNFNINENLLSLEVIKEKEFFLGETWIGRVSEFCSMLSVDLAARHYFHSLINIGDEIIPDMSRFKNSGYWGKKYNDMKGIVKDKGISSLTVDFENGDKNIYLCTEHVIEINGKKDSYQNYLRTIWDFIEKEKEVKK